jgi:hypothetical protein
MTADCAANPERPGFQTSVFCGFVGRRQGLAVTGDGG